MLQWLRRLLPHPQPTLFEWIVQHVDERSSTPIQSALDGEVLIEGHARAGDGLLRSPISGISVIGFRVTIRSHRLLLPPRQLLDWSQITSFRVQDASGVALVNAVGARMMLNHEYSADSATQSLPRQVMDLVNQYDGVDWSRDAPAHFSWSEHYLEPGEPVLILGRARRESDPGLDTMGYRQSATRLVLEHLDDGILFVTDQGRESFLRRVRS